MSTNEQNIGALTGPSVGAANQDAPPGNNAALLLSRVIGVETEFNDPNDGACVDSDAMVEESGDKSRPSERPEVTEPSGSNSGREGPDDSNGQVSNSETANEPSIIVPQPYVWTPQAAKFDTKQ